MTQAVLPGMRARRATGHREHHIDGRAHRLSGRRHLQRRRKFALEGISEALAKEVAHWASKSRSSSPVHFARTGRDARWFTPAPDPEYKRNRAGAYRVLEKRNGKQPGDPRKAAPASLQKR